MNSPIFSILKTPFATFFIPFVSIFLLIISSSILSIIERRLLALFQNRYGPNRVGWKGCLQVVADGIKLLFKEDWIPPFGNSFIFTISPTIPFICFSCFFATIPFSKDCFITNLNIGVLFFLMISSLSVYGILLSGWSSNNKYSLLGAIRASAQMLSYEIFLGLSIMGVVAISGSFNIIDIVNQQYRIWNIFPQFFGFLSFFIGSLAVCHRHPFDQPESEQELADGYHIEYSGMKFGLFFISEYISMIVVSALMVCLFFGGWLGPWFPSYIWFFFKTIFFLFIFILIRASLPRPRYVDVIFFGWTICFPITLINLLITAFFILKRNN